jgi:hypothetical protein
MSCKINKLYNVLDQFLQSTVTPQISQTTTPVSAKPQPSAAGSGCLMKRIKSRKAQSEISPVSAKSSENSAKNIIDTDTTTMQVDQEQSKIAMDVSLKCTC